MKYFVSLGFLLFSIDCAACDQPPPYQSVTAEALLAKSTNVSLARVVKATTIAGATTAGEKIEYYFEVEKRFSGPDEKKFKIEGTTATWGDADPTFSNHFDKSFWKSSGGRLSNSPDCQIHPEFSVGETYLVILDQPYTRKNFELVIRTHGNALEKDKWLQFVEKHFSSDRNQP